MDGRAPSRTGDASVGRAAALLLGSGPGVYRFRAADGTVLYLGRAVNLRRRVLSYFSDLRDRGHLAPMVAATAAVEAVPCASEHEAAWLERNLLEGGLPPWNLTAGGQEVPVYVVVDGSVGAPRLAVVHEPPAASATVLVFGPYLGGSRARRAVSALERVFPLGYTCAELTGTARGLAGARGVRPADRPALVRSIAAVLGGDPDACGFRAELLRRRAAAAERLSFEQAARLQEEIEAVDWLLAPQRATVPGGGDHDVHGWAGGRLVGLTVRNGRVCGWTERPCDRETAQPLLLGADPRWQPLADEAARLAARLSGDVSHYCGGTS